MDTGPEVNTKPEIQSERLFESAENVQKKLAQVTETLSNSVVDPQKIQPLQSSLEQIKTRAETAFDRIAKLNSI